MHGNMFAAYKVNFFVFTNRRLSNEELTQINQVAPSSDLIKIRYTRKTYKKLLEALPPSIACLLYTSIPFPNWKAAST